MWFASKPPVKPGDAAPPFTLVAHDGRPINLVDYRGRQRVVLAFYPEDDTPGCRHEMTAFESNLSRFNDQQTQVFGISHNLPASQARFAEKLELNFPLLSDAKAEAAKLYGAKGLLPFFSRKTYVVDGRGVLRLVMNGMPDMDQLVDFLSALKGDLPEA